MRFSDPPGEAIVIDGQYVWVYTPSTVPGQVVRLAVMGGPAYGYNLLAWLLDRPTERYHAAYLRSERIDGKPADVIQLVPAVPDLPFTKAIRVARPGGCAAPPIGNSGAVWCHQAARSQAHPGKSVTSRPHLYLQGAERRPRRRPVAHSPSRIASTRAAASPLSPASRASATAAFATIL